MTRICVPVCARSIDQLRDAIERAAEVADITELRLDCLDDVEAASRMLDGRKVVWTAADLYAALR